MIYLSAFDSAMLRRHDTSSFLTGEFLQQEGGVYDYLGDYYFVVGPPGSEGKSLYGERRTTAAWQGRPELQEHRKLSARPIKLSG